MNRYLAVSIVAVAAALAACSDDPPPLRTVPTAPSGVTIPGRTAVYIVTGVVRDSATARPLDKASIEFAFAAEDYGERGEGATTTSAGSYELAIYSVLAGPSARTNGIWMRVRRSGYVTQQLEVTLTGEKTTQDFALLPASQDLALVPATSVR